MTRAECEAAFLVESIDNAVLNLEIFKAKAAEAVVILKRKVDDLGDMGLDEQDQYRSNLMCGLIKHLEGVHNLVGREGLPAWVTEGH